ncbi:PAS and helix-turn-helix domain-containing protein [Schlegelella sp. S2-27]|uniref:PAS and helix-turn-helix domain-containing protein n=1 Tax=Caldimonas mangrovi TaxID=2944811 RepID=A0ABT0YJ27_9BURK|nr:PAS and helix-turn-helix domain-containing protein [Caldimonas mangrovi]MCM5678409.1 PAS and helix-turn-helix domain-containing protein [Caldimonas mangrovi]
MGQDVDYRIAFELAPVGLVLSRHRVIVDCNEALAEMFRTSRELLIGQSFLMLYPSPEEFERTGERITPVLNARGRYADDRIMKRGDGDLFWCHVTGRAMERASPHAAGIWSFEDLSSRRPVKAELTGREREVAALLIEGQTSKQIGRVLGISHRTVDIYRARLMRKFKASTTPELVQRLLAG